jgi:diguanylate cyclase (GGDEF)-like protein
MRILISDDDHVSRHLLAGLLGKWGYEVVPTADGAQAWDILQRDDSPKLAILDWLMPEPDGLELCRRVRQRRAPGYIYTILLTARDQKQDVLIGLRAGADDYITKPFDPAQLQARLHSARRIVSLQEQLLTTQEALRDQATHDFLTGLWNRPAIVNTLQEELAQAGGESGSVGVIMVSLDDLKAVNDAHGRHVGEAVLVEAGARAKSAVRSFDAVGRYGGDEFVVVLRGCDAQVTNVYADRIRAALAEEFTLVGWGSLPIAASIGVASRSGGGQTVPAGSAESLIRQADRALHDTKLVGKPHVDSSAR